MEENKVMETVTEETGRDLVESTDNDGVYEYSGGIASALPKIGVAVGIIAAGAVGIRKGAKWLKNRPHYKLVKVDPKTEEDNEEPEVIDYDEKEVIES